jgi:UDP-N-acetylglucosamine 2-epimerase
MPRLIFLVAGARPNFMKIAPIARAMDRAGDAFAYSLNRIHYVGHVMVDNLLYQKVKIEDGGAALAMRGLKSQLGRYDVVTLHWPSNVDDCETFARLVSALKRLAEELPLVFPLHPRTRKQLESFGLDLGPNSIPPRPCPIWNF